MTVDIADLSIWNNNFFGSVSPSQPAGSQPAASQSLAASASATAPTRGSFTASPKTLSGSAAGGASVAAATPAAGTLELDIDVSTGDATIVSGGVSIAAVEIDSAGKVLISANWKSFKNFYGWGVKGWSFTKGTPNTAVFAEFTSDASSSGSPIPLPADSVTDYGNIVPVGFQTAGDLTFKYNIVLDAAGNTQSKVGNVVFVNGVPEPTSLALAALGTCGLLSRRRRQAPPSKNQRA